MLVELDRRIDIGDENENGTKVGLSRACQCTYDRMIVGELAFAKLARKFMARRMYSMTPATIRSTLKRFFKQSRYLRNGWRFLGGVKMFGPCSRRRPAAC